MQEKNEFPCIRSALPYLRHPLNSDNLRPICNDLSEKVLHSIRGIKARLRQE